MFMHIRKNPILKACSWPEERIYIEKQKDNKSIETILYHEHNNDYILTEGLTSNLYCLDNKGKKLYTASSNLALPGSMGYIVESVCRSMGVDVIDEAICLSKLVNEEFDLFLTSATKPVQKLSLLIHPNKVTKTILPSHESISGKTINSIRIAVLEEIKKRFTNAATLVISN
jgi:branched-subunit amino acid aminotransferase/4-amino-4-deoxychorismate lyase